MNAATIIDAIKAHGFRVFQRNPSDTWAIYTDQDGKGVAYCQFGRDPRISTVHKGNRTTGTGYVMIDSPAWTKEELERGFAFAPEWATSSDRKTIAKFQGIDDYRKSDPFAAAYKEV